jgi:DNA-binding NarL/FixJ family response regulator
VKRYPGIGGKPLTLDTRTLLDSLASGKRGPEIAADAGCSCKTVRNRVSNYRRDAGFNTVHQAVAFHVAEKIKKSLPLALHRTVDFVMRKK